MSEEDFMMSQSQGFPAGQKRLMEFKQEALKKVQKDHNSRLIMRNNQKDCDDGVKKILLALEVDFNLTKTKNITKPMLVATLAFLLHKPLSEANDINKLKVDKLKKEISSTYDYSLPQVCK